MSTVELRLNELIDACKNKMDEIRKLNELEKAFLDDELEVNHKEKMFTRLKEIDKYDFEEEWTYSTECAAWNACEDCVSWLNDWYEGQQNVEYLAISKLEEETCTNESEYNLVDGFECSNCGIIIENYNEIEIDEDYPEDRCMKEYAPRYCPNCGRKIVD